MTQRTRHLAPDRPFDQAKVAPASTPGTRGQSRVEPGSIRPGDEARFDPRAWRQAAQADVPQFEAPASKLKPAAQDARKSYSDESPSPQLSPELEKPRFAAAGGNSAPDRSSHRLEITPAVAAAMVPAAASSRPAIEQDGAIRWRYLAVWAVLGSVSAAYVAGMAWQRSANFELAIAPVTETLERLAADIADLKQVTTAIDARERMTADRVASTESRLNRFADAAIGAAQVSASTGVQAVVGHGQRPTNRSVLADDAPAPSAPSGALPAEPQRAKPSFPGIALAQPGTPPGLVVGPAASNADPRNDIRTAVQPKGVVVPGVVNPVKTGTLAQPQATGRKQAGLLIASGPSVDAMRLSWNVITQNHGVALGPVEPRILPAGDGSVFQLIAGPYATDADAAKACANLRSRGVTCRMTEFTGAAL